MKEIIVETESEKNHSEFLENSRNIRKKMKVNISLFLLFVGLWLGVTYYTFTYSKGYLDAAINNVQQENALNIKELNESIKSISNEIRSLRENMEDAGIVITNTSDVQSRIDEKLLDLESQLKQLEKSLQILQEAPDDAEN